ncbi:MAG: phosphohistidine phosphatase SixA [Anaerolineae bacterium]|nr:phosphohistidine phosphatase SixA [Anaerolineae bacterium]MDW8173788.1 phosphohistidine phosphatase SixA [Anaerolineae bacterium]
MIVYLMRHGKAEDLAISDEARALTSEGVRKTEEAARVLAHMKIQPSAIYASPRVRAQQTAHIVAKALGLTVTTREALDFNFDLGRMVSLLAIHEDQEEVLLVGHNPSLSEVVRSACGANVMLKKGAVAALNWSQTAPRQAELLWLATPALFGSLGK